jgi:Sulfotransferase family
MRRLVFIHIPKTAGMTLRAVIRRNYPPHTVWEVPRGTELVLSPEQAGRLQVITGHVPFGADRALGLSADSITVLRQPIERLVSMYYYIRRRGPEHPLARYAAGSLADFADSDYFELRNDMTRQLSGLPRTPDAHTLAVAKHNLLHELVAFGTDDRFDESLLLFQRALGWRTIHYLRENVTERRPPLAAVDAAARRMLERNNQLDLELWEVAVQELAARIEAQPAEFHESLRRFRRRNRAYAAVVSTGRALPRPVKRMIKRVLQVNR